MGLPVLTLPVMYHDLPRDVRRYVREEYVRRQGGKCWHCDASLNGPQALRSQRLTINTRLFPDGFFEHPIHLHHDHRTGLTLGAVHARCNAYLFQYLGQ